MASCWFLSPEEDVSMSSGGIPSCLHSWGDETPPGVPDQLHQGPPSRVLYFRIRPYILNGFPCLGNCVVWMEASQRMLWSKQSSVSFWGEREGIFNIELSAPTPVCSRGLTSPAAVLGWEAAELLCCAWGESGTPKQTLLPQRGGTGGPAVFLGRCSLRGAAQGEKHMHIPEHNS